MNGKNRIVQPGVANVNVQFIPAPLAAPVSLVIPDSSGPQLGIIGGLSKLEHAAIQIAAGLATDICGVAEEQAIPVKAVGLAIAVLSECQRVQTQTSPQVQP